MFINAEVFKDSVYFNANDVLAWLGVALANNKSAELAELVRKFDENLDVVTSKMLGSNHGN